MHNTINLTQTNTCTAHPVLCETLLTLATNNQRKHFYNGYKKIKMETMTLLYIHTEYLCTIADSVVKAFYAECPAGTK